MGAQLIYQISDHAFLLAGCKYTYIYYIETHIFFVQLMTAPKLVDAEIIQFTNSFAIGRMDMDTCALLVLMRKQWM